MSTNHLHGQVFDAMFMSNLETPTQLRHGAIRAILMPAEESNYQVLTIVQKVVLYSRPSQYSYVVRQHFNSVGTQTK